MNNPLGRGEQPRAKTNLRYGDRMNITGTSKDMAHSKTIEIVRTDRPYIDDFVDASNGPLKDSGMEWVVGAGGGMHLQFKQSPKALTEELKVLAEQDRQRWLHRHRFPERYV